MADGFQLDERQTSVWEALASRSAKLAGMYRAALSAFAEQATAGCESARVSVVCHCMREIVNGLPGVMTDLAIPRPAPNSDALKWRLPELLAAHPDLDLGADQDLVPVPKEVAQAFLALIRTSTQEAGRNRSNAAALLTDGTDPQHPVVAQWTLAQRFFLGWTHLDRNHEHERALPSNEELLANIRVVEDVIEVRSALFFENVHALEDLLRAANAEDGGEA